jgi:hypothetical protein
MNGDPVQLDESARVFWSPVLDLHGKQLAGGGERNFDSVADAVRFVMEDLDGLNRVTAFIQIDRYHGHVSIGQIREIYEGSDFRRLKRLAERVLKL